MVLHLGVLGRQALGVVLERDVVGRAVVRRVVWRDGRLAAVVACVLVAQSVHAGRRRGLM